MNKRLFVERVCMRAIGLPNKRRKGCGNMREIINEIEPAKWYYLWCPGGTHLQVKLYLLENEFLEKPCSLKTS